MTTARAAGGSAWPSTVNVTFPVGVPDVVLVTTAVKVTGWPNVAGLADDVSCIAVARSAGALTVWSRGVATELEAKAVSPP